MITISLDIYEGIEDFESRIHLLVSFARCLRIILFYVLLDDLIQILNEKCKNSRKSEISAIKRISNLDTLLRELLIKCGNKEKLLKAGITRAIILSKRLKNKAKVTNQLNEASLQSDKMEFDSQEIKEVRNREIDK